MPTTSLPRISMSPSARYTTQSAVYDRLLHTGPLTDKRIEELCRAGYYGTDKKLEQIGRDLVRESAKKARGQKAKTIGAILARYGI